MKIKMTLSAVFLSLVLSGAQAASELTDTENNDSDTGAASTTQETASSRDLAGKVTKIKGKVFYHKNNSVRSTRVKKGSQNLYVLDMLRTKKKSQAYLSLADSSKLILEENSVIHFNGVKQITAEKGIILFDIKKQGELKGLKITTKTAVIGIKGTQFIIDTTTNSLKLYMKEGLVNVEALDGGTFEHHLKEEQSYKDYMKDMLTSFSEYKAKQQQEFVEFVKSIDVPANKAISINGNKLEDIEIPGYINKQFELLDSFDEKGFTEESKKLEENVKNTAIESDNPLTEFNTSD